MNPLRGLASNAEAIARYTTTIEGPIVLVGYSYDGGHLSGCGQRDGRPRSGIPVRVRASGGRSFMSVMEPFPPSMLAGQNVARPCDAPGAVGGPDMFIKIEEFHETFCAALSEDVAGPMAVSQRPLAAAAFTEPASAVGWRDLPSWYLVRT